MKLSSKPPSSALGSTLCLENQWVEYRMHILPKCVYPDPGRHITRLVAPPTRLSGRQGAFGLFEQYSNSSK